MSKFWHILSTVGGAVLVAVTPAIQTTLSHHPVATTVIATIWAIVGNLLKSPVQN